MSNIIFACLLRYFVLQLECAAGNSERRSVLQLACSAERETLEKGREACFSACSYGALWCSLNAQLAVLEEKWAGADETTKQLMQESTSRWLQP